MLLSKGAACDSKKTKLIKACVYYFLSNFYFSPNDSYSKIIKNVFLSHLQSSFHSQDIQLFYFYLPFFFSPSATVLEVDPR